MTKLSIKLNTNPTSEPCPLCGNPTNPNIGAELALADCDLVVCHDCGRLHAPLLVGILDLSFSAREFAFAEKNFGLMWQETKEVKHGLDWNVIEFDEAA